MRPDRPLNLHAERLTLKQQKRFLRLLSTKQDTAEDIDDLERLLAACSDWTYEELEEITADELQAAFSELQAMGAKVIPDPIPPAEREQFRHWAAGATDLVPDWVSILRVVEQWHLPPWIIENLSGDELNWVYRQFAWNEARDMRAQAEIERAKHHGTTTT